MILVLIKGDLNFANIDTCWKIIADTNTGITTHFSASLKYGRVQKSALVNEGKVNASGNLQ